MTKLEGGEEDCEELFKSFDEDGDGEISPEEFAKAIVQAVQDSKAAADEE